MNSTNNFGKKAKRLIALLLVLSLMMPATVFSDTEIQIDSESEYDTYVEYSVPYDTEQEDVYEYEDEQEPPYIPATAGGNELVNIVPFNGSFTVTFNPGLGTVQPGFEGPQPVTGPGNTFGALPNATLPSFAFRNWIMPDGVTVFTSTTVVDENTPGVANDNLTVTAQWGARITFVLNGPAGSIDPIVITPGGSVNAEPGVSWPDDPEWPGWTFNGWFIGPGPGGAGPFHGGSTFDNDTTLTARWTALPHVLVTYNPNNGEITAGHTNTRYAVQSLSIAASSAAPHNLNAHVGPTEAWRPTSPLVWRTGLTMQGWWTTPSGPNDGGVLFAPPGGGVAPATTPVYNDMTVFAHWVIRVTHNANLGTPHSIRDIPASVLPAGGTVDNDSDLGPATEPTRSGHTFNGWWDTNMPPSTEAERAANFPAAVQFFGTDTVTASRTVFAHWIPNPNMTITFNANGGTVEGNPTTNRYVPYSASISNTTSVTMPLHPVRPGYLFLGWFYNNIADNNLSLPLTTGVLNMPTEPTPPIAIPAHQMYSQMNIIRFDVEVYARWISDYTTLILDANGGSLLIDQPRRLVPNTSFGPMREIWTVSGGNAAGGIIGAAVGEPFWQAGDQFVATRTQHEFLGWNTVQDGGGDLFRLSNPGAMTIPGTSPALNPDTQGEGDYRVFAMWAPMVTFNNNWTSVEPSYSNDTIDKFIARDWNFATHNSHPNIVNSNITPGTPRPPVSFMATWDDMPGGFRYPTLAFVGWYTHPNGTAGGGTRFTDTTIVTEPIELFARWSNEVTFLPGIAPADVISTGNQTRPVPDNSGSLGINMPPDPVWLAADGVTHYRHFLRWNRHEDATGTVIDANSPIEGPMTLFAMWGVAVTFDGSGGTFSALSGNPATRPWVLEWFPGEAWQTMHPAQEQGANVPTRDNWTRIPGWMSTQYAFDPITNAQLVAGVEHTPASPMIDTNRTLYARWQGVVTFDPNGGTIPGGLGNVRTLSEHATVATMPTAALVPTPVRTGYTFIGWMWEETDEDDSGNILTTLNKFDMDTPMTMGHVTVRAQWLEIEKEVDRSFAAVDNILTYTITVTNGGGFDLEDVLVTDIIDAHLAFIPADLPTHELGNVQIDHDGSNDATDYDITGQTLTVMIDELAEDDTVVITFQVVVLDTARGHTIPNFATISGTAPGNDGDWSVNTNTVTTEVPDISIAKTVSQHLASVEDTLTYTITIRNHGTAALTGVDITDVISDLLIVDASSIEVSPSTSTVGVPGFDSASNTLTLNISTLGVFVDGNPNAGVTITFEADVHEDALGHTIPNFARITNAAWDGGYIDSNTVRTDVPNLVFEKEVDKTLAVHGDILTYTLTITNDGPSIQTDLLITDVLSDLLEFAQIPGESDIVMVTVGASLVNPAPAISGDTLTVTIPALGAGETVEIQFGALILQAAEGRTIPNFATVTRDVWEGEYIDTETVYTDVPDITFEKRIIVDGTEHTASVARVGDTLSYRIRIQNNGEDTLEDLTITDVIDTDLAFVATPTLGNVQITGTGTWGTYVISGSTLTIPIDELAEDEYVVIEFEVVVQTTAAGERIPNVATVARDEWDDETLSSNTVRTDVPNLVFEKEVDLSVARVDDTLTYTITIENFGPSTQTDLTITDIIDTTLIQFVPEDLIAGTALGNVVVTHSDGGVTDYEINTAEDTLTVEIEELASGDVVTITFQVVIQDDALGGYIPNFARVERDPYYWSDGYLDTETVTTDVPDLYVFKVVDMAIAEVGDILTYEITIRNDGAIAIDNLLVTDEINTDFVAFVTESTQGNVQITGVASYDIENDDTLLVTILTLAPGATVTITFQVEVLENALGEVIENTVIVTSDEWQEDGYLDAGTETVVPDVEIVKAVNVDDSVPHGTTLTYTITVTNHGPHDLIDLTVTDVLHSTWLEFVDDSVNITPAAIAMYLFDENTNTLTVDIPLLEVDQTMEITFQAVVLSAAAGNEIENIAAVSGPGLPEEGFESNPVVVEVTAVVTGGNRGSGGGSTVIEDDEVPLGPFVAEHIWYVRGFPDGSFRPGNSITRAEISMILFRLLDSQNKYLPQANRFGDIQTTSWYAQAVNYLAYRDVVTGFPDGNFRPNAPITRAELTAVMSRFFELHDNGVNIFSDVPGTHWAIAYINNANNRGWVTGFEDGTFRPNNATSRAEAVTLINRVLNRIPNPETIAYWVGGLTFTDRDTLFNDITDTHWAYYQIMEAAIEHEYELDANDREIWITIDIPWLDTLIPLH